MELNFGVIQEPRGIMRIIHFVSLILINTSPLEYQLSNLMTLINSKYFNFVLSQILAIFAFLCVKEFTGYLTFHCNGVYYPFVYKYPYDLEFNETLACGHTYEIYGDFSGDAKFFVWTGFLALVYSFAISVIYVKYDRTYLQNPKLPLAVSRIFGFLCKL